jgi:hypothetical protein
VIVEFGSAKVLAFEVPADPTEATPTVRAQPFTCAFANGDCPYRGSADATAKITLPED